jgi:hypothetical protein
LFKLFSVIRILLLIALRPWFSVGDGMTLNTYKSPAYFLVVPPEHTVTANALKR